MTREDEEIERYVTSLNGKAWGMALGFLFGIGLFVATNILVLKGGPNVGEHLSLLAQFFPGYRVTFVGSLIGFVYAFVVGYAVGRVICIVYRVAAR
jgi:hypothetical protein